MSAVSVVVPLHNEEENLPLLYDRLKAALDPLGLKVYEFIFIDDGSLDRTWGLIEDLSKKDIRVKGVKLSRNFGQQSALTAGLEKAGGDAVIMMDGDLQHPPELIGQLIAKWREGYDIVYTKRERNENYGWLKNSLSKCFAALFNRMSTVEVQEGVLDFRLVSRPAVEALKELKERTRFFRGLVSWVGFRSTYIAYTAPKRLAGTTKYSLRRSLALAVTGLLSFSPKPLYLAGFLGLIVTSASAVYIVYAIYVKFFTDLSVPGWTSILISVLFLGGVQLMTIGILGAYLGMVYEEVKGRPSYIVHKTVGFPHG